MAGCTVEGSVIGLLVTGEGTLAGNTLSGNSYGMVLYDVNNSLIYGNTITQNSLAGLAFDVEEAELIARIGLVGSMESPESGNNTIYNNYFNNVNNTLINSEANNSWNTSKIAGTSIVGGPYLGGNYWANPNGTGFSENCTDADKDGIADSSYEIINGTFDYLPLTIIPPHQPLPPQQQGTEAPLITFPRMEKVSVLQALTVHRKGLLRELRPALDSITLFQAYWGSVSLQSSIPEMSSQGLRCLETEVPEKNPKEKSTS